MCCLTLQYYGFSRILMKKNPQGIFYFTSQSESLKQSDMPKATDITCNETLYHSENSH